MKMEGVTEYCEEFPVELVETKRWDPPSAVGRLVVKAWNEGGGGSTEVDVLELVAWLKRNRPDLLE